MNYLTTGADFRAIRHLLNLSQQGCADLLSVNRVTIARYETDRQPINPRVYAELLSHIDTLDGRAKRAIADVRKKQTPPTSH